MERKTCYGSYTSSVKASIKQTGKISFNKKQDRNTNLEILPADHLTKKFLLNPEEGSRSAPTISSNQNQSVMG